MGGFYTALADASGIKITASEQLLSPAPTNVDYPTSPIGSRLPTPDGKVIVQQPIADFRERSWIWIGYPESMGAYQNLMKLLESLRSRTRIEAGAATPYVFLKDDTTGEFTRLDIINGIATSGTATTLVDTGALFTVDALIGYEIEIIDGTGSGQQRTVIDNDTTSVTVDTWTTTPDATSVYSMRGKLAEFFRVRVLEVSRELSRGGGSVRYEQTRMVFVVDDAAFGVAPG